MTVRSLNTILSEFGLQVINEALSFANFTAKLYHNEKPGLLPSLRYCYENMRDEGKDIVMQAQDDYLYDEQCFYQMILFLKNQFNYQEKKMPEDLNAVITDSSNKGGILYELTKFQADH